MKHDRQTLVRYRGVIEGEARVIALDWPSEDPAPSVLKQAAKSRTSE
jgi:hypothetical protein